MQELTDQETILRTDDIKFLLESNAGRHLIKELELKLNQCRLEVDQVKPDRLLALQGKIETYKEILCLFN